MPQCLSPPYRTQTETIVGIIVQKNALTHCDNITVSSRWLIMSLFSKGKRMDFNVFSAFYLVPLVISAIGGLIEFKNCAFPTPQHALRKAFFLTFRSMVPVLNIFSAILYLITCGTFTWKKSTTWKKSASWKKSAFSKKSSEKSPHA